MAEARTNVISIHLPFHIGDVVKFQHDRQTKEWSPHPFEITGIDIILRPDTVQKITYMVRRYYPEEKTAQIPGIDVGRLRIWGAN